MSVGVTTMAPETTPRRLQLGDVLYGDDDAVVADTLADAAEFWEDHTGDWPETMHSMLAVPRIVTQEAYEECECHEDAEVGDTTWDFCTDDGRELSDSNEIQRVWLEGPPGVRWKMEPLPPESIDAMEIPVGTSVWHSEFRDGRTAAASVRIDDDRVEVEVDFGFPRPERREVCSAGDLRVLMGGDWPEYRWRLTIDGEHVLDGSKQEVEAVLKDRERQHAAEWRESHPVPEWRCDDDA